MQPGTGVVKPTLLPVEICLKQWLKIKTFLVSSELI